MTFSTDGTDVGLVSLDDRRKIRALEAQVDTLTRQLSEARERVRPALENKRGECLHFNGFLVSDNEPVVTCGDCGAVVEPYMVLRKIAHREMSFCYTLNALREETKRLNKEVDSLKGKRARLRGQVSKATPDIPFDDIAAAMKRAGADSLLVRQVSNEWGAWFYLCRSPVVQTPAMRTMKEAVAKLVELADAKLVATPDGAAATTTSRGPTDAR